LGSDSISVTTLRAASAADPRRAAGRACPRRGFLLTILAFFPTPALLAQPAAQAPVPARGTITYFIAPGDRAQAYRDGDPELARWALAAWQRASVGAFDLVEVKDPEAAAIRIVFAGARGGTFGLMRPSRAADGTTSATVMVYADTEAFGAEIAERARSDPLYRDAIVYLTCVHEIGHALGLVYTAEFTDIMYWFGYGGDIPAFFGRYRDRLRTRADIARTSGLSPGDIAQLRGTDMTPLSRPLERERPAPQN
jgi:hypothetical protein